MSRSPLQSPSSSRLRRALPAALAVLAVGLFVLGLWLGGHPGSLPAPVRDRFVSADTRTFDRALEEVGQDYYRPVPRRALMNAALDGMVRSLDDQFSHYFSPVQFRQVQEETNAQFTGVGMGVQPDPRGLRIVHVYQASPAQRAGLRDGDVVVAADGRSLAGRPASFSSSLIRGRPGTQVRLTVVSAGRRTTRTLTRAVVSIPLVASRLRPLPGGAKAAVIALSAFSTGAHGEVRQAIDQRVHQGAKAIVLDLRDNPGGLVEEARLVASIFVPEGPIVSTRGRAVPPRTLMATGGAIPTSIPVVVLVNRDSASAAEIVTGALQDHRRATVVGTRTFGKGVFQEVLELPNGGALDITVGQYFTPNGRNLGGGGVKPGLGIQPDVRAQDDPRTRGRDEGLDAALRVLGGKLAGR